MHYTLLIQDGINASIPPQWLLDDYTIKGGHTEKQMHSTMFLESGHLCFTHHRFREFNGF
jgi:hypothetical protein